MELMWGFLFLGRRYVWTWASIGGSDPSTVEKVFLFHVKKQLWRGGKEEKGNMKRQTLGRMGGWVGGQVGYLVLPWTLP